MVTVAIPVCELQQRHIDPDSQKAIDICLVCQMPECVEVEKREYKQKRNRH
jgi:hypothetical protein